MMQLTRAVLFVLAILAGTGAFAAEDGYVTVNLSPVHDTYAEHYSGQIHGLEPIIKVGVTPYGCDPAAPSGGSRRCEKGKECCVVEQGDNYCADAGLCASTPPNIFRYGRPMGYLRFPLYMLPAGKVHEAILRMNATEVVAELGGDPQIYVTRLRKIGLGDSEICEWDEATLDGTNGTTWSSLPQNTTISEGRIWAFHVEKSMRDWLEGDTDLPGMPIAPNCGFMMHDDRYPTDAKPLKRWVEFSSKEGESPPMLSVVMALDLDHDGFFGDCNEDDPLTNPAALEFPDGEDNDCDGLIDEENCDGLDNDEDGAVDEDEGALCGPGYACIMGACVLTCKDECASVYEKKCVKTEEGTWTTWHCGQWDPSYPCKTFMQFFTCEADQYCGWGSCSSNCVDDCDNKGETGCTDDYMNFKATALCDDWDEDGCLEWGELSSCGPGATCSNGVCGAPVCTDECPEAGVVECMDSGNVRACLDQDKDHCLEWNDMGACGEGYHCTGGVCAPNIAEASPETLEPSPEQVEAAPDVVETREDVPDLEAEAVGMPEQVSQPEIAAETVLDTPPAQDTDAGGWQPEPEKKKKSSSCTVGGSSGNCAQAAICCLLMLFCLAVRRARRS